MIIPSNFSFMDNLRQKEPNGNQNLAKTKVDDSRSLNRKVA